MTGMLFDKLPRSRPPRRLMKVVDVTDYGSTVTMRCKRGHELQVDCVVDDDHRILPSQYTPAELKRGIPCPTCLDEAISKK
jgi:hypothetical protein